MKKLCLLLMFIAFVLTACGGATDTEPTAVDEPAPGEPAADETMEVSEAGQFTFSTWGDPTFFEDGFTRMQEAYPEYADVEWVSLPGGEGTEDLLAKLIVDYTAESWDTMPDMAEMSTSYIPQLASAGLLVDLTERIAPFKDSISPAILDGVTWEGKVYAVPWMPNTAMIWYNSEVFEMAGVDADKIETWDDYIEAGKVIRDYEFPDGVDRYITNADIGWGPGMMIQIMLQQQCSGYFDPSSGELTIGTDPAFRNAIEFWVTAYEEGVLFPVEEWETAWFDALNEGIIASYPSANWMDQVIQLDLEGAEGKWRAMKLPAFAPGGSRASFEGGSANVIVLNKPDVDVDLAWAFIENSYLNMDVTGDLLSDHMLVPAYMPALDHPYYSEPNEFYGGQEVGALDLEIQQEATCAFPYTEYYAEATDLILAELQEVWAGNKTVDEAIQAAADAVSFAAE